MEHGLERAVEDEIKYEAASQECIDWQAAAADKLDLCDDLTGRKQDIQDRLQVVQVS